MEVCRRKKLARKRDQYPKQVSQNDAAGERIYGFASIHLGCPCSTSVGAVATMKVRDGRDQYVHEEYPRCRRGRKDRNLWRLCN